MDNSTTSDKVIRGLKSNPLILHPHLALKQLGVLKGEERKKYRKENPLLTVIGYTEEGKVFVGVAACSKNDSYCRKEGVKKAMKNLLTNPLFIGTIAISDKADNFHHKLRTYLAGYGDGLSCKLVKKGKSTSVSEVLGYNNGFSTKNAKKSKIESEIPETSQTAAT